MLVGVAVDYLSCVISAGLLSLFSLIILAKQFVGSPIYCWGQPQWTPNWHQYAEDYCFSKGGFYWPPDQPLPQALDPRPPTVNNYQWVPLVLLMQAALFHLPNVVWTWMLRTQSVIDYDHVIKTALKLKELVGDERYEKFNTLIKYLRKGLKLTNEKRSHRHLLGFHLKDGSSLLSLSFGYMIVKLLYVVSVGAQIAILHSFLSPKFVQWCFGEKIELFTKVMQCEIGVRALSLRAENPFVQCILAINYWNEAIYKFTGLWMMAIGAIALGSALFYALSFLPTVRRAYVRSIVYSEKKLDEEESWDVGIELMQIASETRGTMAMDANAFADALGHDGALLLCFIESYAGGAMAKEIGEELFRAYNGAEEVQ